MKKLLVLLCLASLLLPTLCKAQTSYVTLSASKDAVIREYNGVGDGNNYGLVPFLNMQAWTNSGSSVNQRSLINFDLSAIPLNAIIQSASLLLYVDINLNTFPGGHQQLSGSNESVIKKITANWDESIVTWNTQPSVTTLNQTIIPQSISNNQDYIIDVTSLVQDMFSDTLNRFGFLIKLINESYYRRMIFASRDNSNAELHPKLSVTYFLDSTFVDCNGVINGTSLMDTCGICQQAYLYDYVTHFITFLDDTINVSLGATEILVMPDDPSNPYWNNCDSTMTNITNTILPKKKELVKIVNVLGQEISYRENTPLFYIYNDGTIERRILIE